MLKNYKLPLRGSGLRELGDLMTHQNEIEIRPDSVIKHYGSMRAKLTHRIAASIPYYACEFSSPEDRCKNEVWVINHLSRKGIPVPRIIDSGSNYLEMGRISGLPVSNIYSNPDVSYEDKLQITEAIGKLTRKMHDADIVHGDFLARQVMAEQQGLNDGQNLEYSVDDRLYLTDFELKPKKFGHYGRTVDNIYYTLTAACYSNLPYNEVRLSYEEGYGSKIDPNIFNENQDIQINTLLISLGISPRSLSNYQIMRRDFGVNKSQMPVKQ